MNLAEKDNKYIWHPYTHQKNKPDAIPIIRGKKSYLYDEKGNKYLDAVSSWWVNIHGHGNYFIAKKLFKQAKKLQQVIFTQFTHKPAVELAEKLLPHLPGSFAKVFYSDNGSTATEVALKMSLQYWQNEGAPERKKILAFHNSYHGDTFGAMSVSERGIYTYAFKEKLFEVLFIDVPNGNNWDAILATLNDNSNDIACFIYEPLLQGAGGMLIYEAHHLQKLLEIIKQKEIICIADEVLTGFYRTGKFFAGDYMKEKADIICLSKALTGGNMALGITACTQRIFNSFVSDDKMATFFHGHSFTANPLACTAGLASLELLLKNKCQDRIKNIIESHKDFCEELKSFEAMGSIKNVRQCGTVMAFEIVTKNADNYLNSIVNDVLYFSMKNGIYLRPMGNTLYVMPPYTTTKKQLRKIYNVIIEFLKSNS
jgi:adenosylmethionine-8-amino-7-oxononanoate aminotransferase